MWLGGGLSDNQMRVFEEETVESWDLSVIPRDILRGSSLPPLPPILVAWHMTNDFDKRDIWKGTVAWAKQNDLEHLIPELTDDERYMVDGMSEDRDPGYPLDFE